MGYAYRAGDNYAAGDYYQAGGLFSGIGRAIGRVARAVVPFTPLAPIAGLIPTSSPRMPDAKGPGRPEPGLTGAVHRLIPGGHTGFLRGRRMNAGNAKAARRAIRRIKAVRHMLQSIERQLPKRKCAHPVARRFGRR